MFFYVNESLAVCFSLFSPAVEAQWVPDEVQVLMTLWAQPNIQKQLLSPVLKAQVFKYLSSELTLVGFNKTPQQCNHKVNSLKEEYKRIKEEDLNGSVQSNWFAILDGVLGSDGAASSDMDSSAAVTQTQSSEYEHEKGVFSNNRVHLFELILLHNLATCFHRYATSCLEVRRSQSAAHSMGRRQRPGAAQMFPH